MEPFPLYTGHIFPILRFFGKTPFLVDLLNITDNTGAVTSMVSLTNMAGILPDLLFFISETHFVICSGVISLNLKGSFFLGIKDRW